MAMYTTDRSCHTVPLTKNMNKQKTILVALLLITLGFLVWIFLAGDSSSLSQADVEIPDPIDAAMDLYAPWLAAKSSTTTEPDLAAVLLEAPLTQDLRSELQQKIQEPTDVDPVLCQLDLPERIGAKVVYVNTDEAQLIVVARGKRVPEQAVVTLSLENNEWIISNISCSRGELAPELEYTFEQEGNLLRESLQPPLDSSQWHLVYERDGVGGRTMPLLFNEASICIREAESVCDQESLTEATAVKVQGAMQEAGVLVQRLEIR